VRDPEVRLDPKRKALAVIALLLLAVSFMPSPERRVVVGPQATATPAR
jgi:hypothetical protein